MLGSNLLHPLQRLPHRFVAEIEGAVVHRDHRLGAELCEGLVGLFGVEVGVFHHECGGVGADGQQGIVDVEPLADLFEMRAVAGVAAEVDATGA